jgi:hypothetical protein
VASTPAPAAASSSHDSQGEGGSHGGGEQHTSHASVSIHAPGGEDAMHTDAANDLFVFGNSTGVTTLDAENGANWTSVVELDVSAGHGDAAGADWTHQISSPDGVVPDADGVNTTPPPNDPHGAHHDGPANPDPISW